MVEQRGFKQGVGSFDVKDTERVHCPRAAQSPEPASLGWIRVGWVCGQCQQSLCRGALGVVEGCLVDTGLGQALPAQGLSAE